MDNSENVNRAVRLLRKAADVLAQTNTNVDTSSSQSTSITTLNTRPSTDNHTSTSTALRSPHRSAASSSRSSGSSSSNFNSNASSSTNEALRNFRLLFSPYGNKPTPRTRTTRLVAGKRSKCSYVVEVLV